jgi:hypothetical protein
MFNCPCNPDDWQQQARAPQTQDSTEGPAGQPHSALIAQQARRLALGC